MLRYLSLLLVLILAGSSTNSATSSVPSEQPVVHAILFWSNGCPHCAQVLTNVLPEIQSEYKKQFSLLMVELVTVKDINNLYDLGEFLGLTQQQVAVPFLLIDHTVLIGTDEIQNKLSGMIGTYLAAGGLEYPNIPQLDELLKNGIEFTSFDRTQQQLLTQTAGTKSSGLGLAWGVMVLMVLAIILVIVMVLRAFQGKSLTLKRSWVDIAIPILSILGLGVSIYLIYVEVSHSRALCGPVGDCNAVQSSPYAKLFGIVPIGLVGAIGYIAILVAWIWQRFRSDSVSRVAGPIIFGMALFGTLFSIYLTYLELFVIHAVCIWCLSSAVIITALMLLSLPPITQWLAIADEEE